MVGSARTVEDETYDLRGLNLITPDQVMPTGETAHTLNSRMFAKDDDENRVTNRTRKGSTVFTAPVGETLNVQHVAAATQDIEITKDKAVAIPITPSASGPLTKVEFELKRTTGIGKLLVRFFTSVAGLPGEEITDTSITGTITDAYGYLPSYLMDAPAVVNGTQIWAILQIQDNGSGSYFINGTATAGAMSTVDNGLTYSAVGGMGRFKTYISIDYPIKGYHQHYPSTGVNRTYFAAGDNVYSVAPNGTVAEVGTVDINSTVVRFADVDDKLVYVDEIIAPRWWNGTTDAAITGAPVGASHVIVWQNRMFFVSAKVRVDFSDLYNFESYPSVNFFYVPRPKSSDHIAGWKVFQDNLNIYTHETKHIIFGSDISSFTRKEAVGTKGAVSEEAIATDRGNTYFMGDDGNIYKWNGVNDEILSEKMEPEFSKIPNKRQVRIHLYRNQLRIYYTKTAGKGNDTMALYDITFKQWFKDTGRMIAGSLELNQDNNELIEFSSRVGQVFSGETGYSDAGKAIDWVYDTNRKIYGSGASKKRVKRFRPFVRPTDADFTMLVGIDFDYEDSPSLREYTVSGSGAKWGEFVWGDGTKFGGKKYVDNKVAMSGRGNHIQYCFRRKGVDTPVELQGYYSKVKVGRPR